MLDFHLSVQPKTEQRLKIILNSVEDGESFAKGIILVILTFLLKKHEFTAISDQTHHEKAISKAQSRYHNVGTNQEYFHQ
jgi:hypothetical protein